SSAMESRAWGELGSFASEIRFQQVAGNSAERSSYKCIENLLKRAQLRISGAWGQTEFQVNLKLGLTPRSPRDPAEPSTQRSPRPSGALCGALLRGLGGSYQLGETVARLLGHVDPGQVRQGAVGWDGRVIP